MEENLSEVFLTFDLFLHLVGHIRDGIGQHKLGEVHNVLGEKKEDLKQTLQKCSGNEHALNTSTVV